MSRHDVATLLIGAIELPEHEDREFGEIIKDAADAVLAALLPAYKETDHV